MKRLGPLGWLAPALAACAATTLLLGAGSRDCLIRDDERGPVVRVARETLSTELDETDAALSPAGDEMVFTVRAPSTSPGAQRVLLHSRCSAGRWSSPTVLFDLGEAFAMSPGFTADGERLVFARRDTTPGAGYHLWSARRDPRAPEGWRLDGPWAPALAATGNDYAPSLTVDGTLYFVSDRPGIAGGQNVLVSRPPYLVATLVDSSLAGADAVEVSRDGLVMVLAIPGRDDAVPEQGVQYGRADLYARRRASDTSAWGPLRRITAPDVNSAATEGAPRLLPDGRLLFTSERGFTLLPGTRIASRRELLRALRRSGNGLGDIYVTRAPLETP